MQQSCSFDLGHHRLCLRNQERMWSQTKKLTILYILMMMIHEENDSIYTNHIGHIVVEIVIVINTLIETQSSKSIYCQTWLLVWLKVNDRVVEWEN